MKIDGQDENRWSRFIAFFLSHASECLVYTPSPTSLETLQEKDFLTWLAHESIPLLGTHIDVRTWDCYARKTREHPL